MCVSDHKNEVNRTTLREKSCLKSVKIYISLFLKRNLTLGTIKIYCTLCSPTDSGCFIARLNVVFVEDDIY